MIYRKQQRRDSKEKDAMIGGSHNSTIKSQHHIEEDFPCNRKTCVLVHKFDCYPAV